MNNIVFASVISEIQQSPMFMTVKAVICDTPEANLNGAKVTEKFVSEVVKNEKRYVGLPLYADVKALTNGSYNRLGHLYDVKTGEFHSTQIGSFYKFEKEEFEKGYHLIGYARIPKRNKKLSNAIAELFAQGRLKFSFEVSVGEYEENDDGTITIDASENNYLEGTAIVTYPACEDAVALELVAQKAEERGESEMAEVETKAEVAETEATPVEETVQAEVIETEAEQPELAEEETEETAEEEESEEETSACKKKEKAEEENAEVYVTETTTEAHEVYAYDTETGKNVHQEVVIRTTTDDMLEGTLVEAQDGMHIAEETATEEAAEETAEDSTEEADTPVETPAETTVETPAETAEEVPDSTESKKTAELIAEMAKAIESLKAEIAELKEQKQIAEAKTVTAEINPMVDDIHCTSKYTLLEKDERTTSYSLLQK